MKKFIRLLPLLCVLYCCAMLIQGALSIYFSGMQAMFVSMWVISFVAGCGAVACVIKRKLWILVFCVSAVMLFCPTVLGLWPMGIGFALLIATTLIMVRGQEIYGEEVWGKKNSALKGNTEE